VNAASRIGELPAVGAARPRTMRSVVVLSGAVGDRRGRPVTAPERDLETVLHGVTSPVALVSPLATIAARGRVLTATNLTRYLLAAKTPLSLGRCVLLFASWGLATAVVRLPCSPRRRAVLTLRFGALAAATPVRAWAGKPRSSSCAKRSTNGATGATQA